MGGCILVALVVSDHLIDGLRGRKFGLRAVGGCRGESVLRAGAGREGFREPEVRCPTGLFWSLTPRFALAGKLRVDRDFRSVKMFF